MKIFFNNRKHEAGFTLIELAAVLVILAVIFSIAIPAFSVWLPNYRLRGAARDLYSNLQMAKLGAVKQNKEWAVVFDQTNNRYHVCSEQGGDGSWNVSGGDPVERTVNLDDYEDIYFGHASLNTNILGAPFSGGDHIYYANNWVVFGPRGTSEKGYVYLQNNRDTVYGVGTRPSGVIHLFKWNGSEWN